MNLTSATKISILNGILLILLTLAEFSGILQFSLIFTYQWHKILHILGLILFMGNMIIGPVWFMYAFYSKDKTLLKFANRLLQLTDLYITIPGLDLTIINGLFLASIYGGSKNQTWLYYSIILLLIMWLISIPLIYIQEKIYKSIGKETINLKSTNRLLIIWGIIGTLVMIPPTLIFYLMVFKTF